MADTGVVKKHWHLTTLGSTDLAGAPQCVRVPQTAVWAMLAYMAVQRRVIPRDEFADVVFQGVPSAAQIVRNSLSFLRNWLGTAIVVDSAGIDFAPDLLVTIDVECFLHETRPQASADEVFLALHRYQGIFLGRPRRAWPKEYAEYLQRVYVDALRRAIHLAQQRYLTPYALMYLHKLAQEFPEDIGVQMQYLGLLRIQYQSYKIAPHVATLKRVSGELEDVFGGDSSMALMAHQDPHRRRHMAMERREIASEVWMPGRIFVLDQIGVAIRRFVAGERLLLNIVGERGAGKTHLLERIAFVCPQMKCWKYPGQADSLGVYVQTLMRDDEEFRELVLQAALSLPLPEQEHLARLLHDETPWRSDVSAVDCQVLQALFGLMGRRQRFVLLIDDATPAFLQTMMPIVDTQRIGMIVTSHEPLLPTSMTIPALTTADVTTMVDFLLCGEAYDATLIEDCVAAQLFPMEVVEIVVAGLAAEWLYWDEYAHTWRYQRPIGIDCVLHWSALDAHQRAVLAVIVLAQQALTYAQLQQITWDDPCFDVGPTLQTLREVGVCVGDTVTCHAFAVRHGVAVQLTAAERHQAHMRLAQCTTDVRRIAHLVAIGDYALVQQLLVPWSAQAWQTGNVMLLRYTQRMLQRVPFDSPALRSLRMLNTIRLARYGDALESVQGNLDRLVDSLDMRQHTQLEMLLAVVEALRWGGSTVQSLQLYERIYTHALQEHNQDLAFWASQSWFNVARESGANVHALTYMSQIGTPMRRTVQYAILQMGLAYIYANVGNTTMAQQYLARVGEVSLSYERPDHLFLLYHVGLVHASLRHHDDAVRIFVGVYRVFQGPDDVPFQLLAGAILAMEYTRHGMPERYEQLLYIIYQQSTTTHLTRQRISACLLLAKLAIQRAQWTYAELLVQEGYALARRIYLIDYETTAAALLLRIARATGNSEQTHVAAQRLDVSMARSGDPHIVRWYHDLAWYAYEQLQPEVAIGHAFAALENARVHGISLELPIEVKASAVVILKRCGSSAATMLRREVVSDIIAHFAHVSDPAVRTALIERSSHLQEFIKVRSLQGDVIVWLPSRNAPRGRAPRLSECVPVVWTGEVLQDPQLKIHEKIWQLAEQTRRQQAELLTAEIAEVLDVHVRTILRGLRLLAEAGREVQTYRSWNRTS
jgi:hypothetical protein